MKYTDLPALSGLELIRLLKKDGWQVGEQATHGISLTKKVGKRTLVAVIPNKSSSLPKNTLHRILSVKQTKIKKSGLLKLLNTHGK